MVAPLKTLAGVPVTRRMPPVEMLIVSPEKRLLPVATLRVSPLLMLIVAPDAKVFATVAATVPPLMFKVPVKGLAACSVRVPVPCLLRVPAPTKLPPIDTEPLSPPNVRAPTLSETLPPSAVAKSAMVCVARRPKGSHRSTATTVPAGNALLTPSTMEPAAMLVAPV